MDYPKTDDDWEKLAECIVTKHTGVFPETVGELTVGATATIFGWYKGEERSHALTDRQYARERLVRLAKEAGCLEEREELKMSGRMVEMDMGNPDGWMMSQEEAERLGMGEMHRQMTSGGTSDRPIPQTYGDWVNLGESIKEKAGISDFETTSHVNIHLQRIYDEEENPEVAQQSKRFLTRRAGELGIR